jgi:D-glycero-D-manno-heptose 1,7-bisphosphate phosphatase
LGRLIRRAAFVDRDGTINVQPREHEYVTSLTDFTWLPGAARGLTHLGAAGFELVVVSNQRGVARGLVAPEVISQIEDVIQRELARHGIHILAFRYCFHDEWERCACRKPKPGMLLDAAREFDLDLKRSWMIGDSASDIAAGRAAGCRTASVRGERASDADVVADSLLQAAELIAGPAAQRAPEADSASNASTSAR